MVRREPNIIITGTPGVGKSSHCEPLAQSTGLKHLGVNQIIKEKGCHEGWSEQFGSFIVDDEKLLDAMEEQVKDGGYIIDWHACDLFPESWIDLVVVLRTDSSQIYDRLKARDYPETKLQENLDSEIMEVILTEARESYDEQIIVELRSNDNDDLESNVERLETWVANWRRDNAKEQS